MERLDVLLAQHPFLKGMAAEHLALMAGCASNVVYQAGEFLHREGNEADRFFFIRQGRVSVEVYDERRRAITIETLGEGEVLGWSWLVPPYRWRFDARAEALTRALVLDGKCLREKCETDHHLGYQLMRRIVSLMARSLDATRLQLLDVYDNDRGAHGAPTGRR